MAKSAACLAALVALTNCGGGSAEGEATEALPEQVGALETARTFAPVADTRVEGTSPDSNFGGSSVLKVDASPLYESYLRFELSGLSGTVKRATLRLYSTDATAHGPTVHRVDSGWQERELTYTSRPGEGSPVASSGPLQAGAWVEWDVTPSVTGNGTVSLAVRPTGSDGTVFHSREGADASLRPQLVVVTDSASTPPSGCTTGTVRREQVVLATDAINVDGSSPNTPAGKASVLEVDGSPLHASYLRFNVGTLSQPLVGARLRVYAVNGTADGPKLYRTDANWSESSGVTWNTRPANVGSAVGDSGSVSVNAWVEFDVGSVVKGAGAYSFGLLPDVTDGADFVARGDSRTTLVPQLVLTTEETACTDGGTGGGTTDGGTGGGTTDGGTGGTTDGGTGGTTDGGTGGSTDGGTGGSTDGGTTTPPPTSSGWTFYGAAQGGPRQVFGVSADQGGNIWVAGGEEGLYVLEKGASQFRRFTMADGLRPYGYMLDGSAPSGTKYLKVVSVAGGPAGTAFVGYEGKKPASGMPTCEDEWDQAYYDGRTPDASIYKSGDADRVTLSGSGISVVHYDLSTGPNKVRDEPRGREKVCNIWRIVYDAKTNSVWFGANHGFAHGRADFAGYSCHLNAGQTWDYFCAGVMEHVHPAINAWNSTGTKTVLLTDAYYGASLASNGDVWFGGANRTTRFRYGTNGNNYWRAQAETENRDYAWNRMDIWPDAVGEPNIPTREQRVDDNVSGLAVMGDQSVWVGSFTRGLAQLDSSGRPLRYLSTQLADGKGYVGAVAADPSDESVWVGMRWGGGLSRVRGGTITQYGASALGSTYTWMTVSDIQVDRSSSTRRVLVAFQGSSSQAGAIGIYTGP